MLRSKHNKIKYFSVVNMFSKVIFLLLFTALANGDLYNSSDPMVLLTAKNFYETILSSKNGWIVEFYNSWCGHCISFAPKWREFSKEIKDWNHTIKAAVIDCSDEENVSICRDYEVMGYPSIRLFGANTQKGKIGKSVKNRGVNGMQSEIIDFIIDEEQSHMANKSKIPSSWVNLLSYQGTLKDIFKESSLDVKNAVLIVEKGDSKVACHSILDLAKYPMVLVRRINSEAAELKAFNLNKFPSVLVIPRKGNTKVLLEDASTPEEITALIFHHLRLTRNLLQMNDALTAYKSLDSKLKQVNEREDIEGAGDGNLEEINSQRLNYDDDLPDAAFSNAHVQVNMVDIENGISYALRHEVTLHKVLEGETLEALKSFVTVTAKYMPFRPSLLSFLSKLREFLAHKKSLSGVEFEKILKELESSDAKLPDKQPWRECQGSEPKYRGYPCGLWTLFHSLTVNAFMQKDKFYHYNPLESLKAIHGYVKNFFSCEYCSKHFQEMYKLDAETSVKSPGDEVIWLWRAHNKVNKRLHGDLSEDPKHPKEQFPSKVTCPKCWFKGLDKFNNDEVLKFLMRLYGKNSISLEGSTNLLREKGNNSGNSHKNANNFISVDKTKIHKKIAENNESNVKIQKLPSSTWNFDSTDLNLCVLLYLASTLIIAAGYFMFILKRKLRRKKYLEFYKIP
ncbi:Sulfhydryl oxidase 2 [Armadillidium vulgare]|nr:Sulfhydryl oxidase 2 [Armadillidium vulgare]